MAAFYLRILPSFHAKIIKKIIFIPIYVVNLILSRILKYLWLHWSVGGKS